MSTHESTAGSFVCSKQEPSASRTILTMLLSLFQAESCSASLANLIRGAELYALTMPIANGNADDRKRRRSGSGELPARTTRRFAAALVAGAVWCSPLPRGPQRESFADRGRTPALPVRAPLP